MRSIGYVAKSRLRVMTQTFPSDDVADADERVDNGNVLFRTVVSMTSCSDEPSCNYIMLDVRVCFRMDGLSERDFNGYINFRIIPFHSTIFGVEFPKNIVNPIAVCYCFTSNRYFFSDTACRNLQRWVH
jgi:hypothetical protein